MKGRDWKGKEGKGRRRRKDVRKGIEKGVGTQENGRKGRVGKGREPNRKE